MKRDITMRWVRLEDEGGCNACVARPSHLLSISFRGITVRLCPECAKLLRRELLMLPAMGLGL